MQPPPPPGKVMPEVLRKFIELVAVAPVLRTSKSRSPANDAVHVPEPLICCAAPRVFDPIDTGLDEVPDRLKAPLTIMGPISRTYCFPEMVMLLKVVAPPEELNR